MKICVFDTETVSLEKPFCYNVGYVIFDTETQQTLTKKDFVIEQVWHNIPLFSTAYYAEKRPLYVARMRGRKTILDKWGRVCQTMIRDFKAFDVQCAYAYNSGFDEKVFAFNCDFFKTCNPFDNIQIFDIRGNVHQKIAFTVDFKDFCEKYEYFTESGNYSTTAETLFRYISKNIDFVEEHTALSDSEIELEILKETVLRGCEYQKAYKTYQSIPRKVKRFFTVIDTNKQEFLFECEKISFREKRTKVILK